MKNNEIIEVKQLPVIVEQLQVIKEDVTARVNEALNLDCTEDSVKVVKKARADLNAELKYWEGKRKEVKTAIMNPYNQFEAVYKECISDIYKSADSELKGKIDSVENELKEQKRKEVFYYFEELCEANGLDFLTFEKANINVTLSASLKSLKEQAKSFVDRVCDDLNLIDTQEHKDEIMYEYKRFLNVSLAITTVSMRYKAIEEEKAREAERKAKEEAARMAAEKVEEIVDSLTPPTISEDIGDLLAPPITLEPIAPVSVRKFTFEVTASDNKIERLIEFLESENYYYECV